MNKQDPLDQLSHFYQTLDSIPTPALSPKPARRFGFWGMLIAPLGASLLAYLFVSVCALGPTNPDRPVSIQMAIDRYALHEIRAESVPAKPANHALNLRSGRLAI